MVSGYSFGTNVGSSNGGESVHRLLDKEFVVIGIESFAESLVVIGINEFTRYRQPL